jgi:hypothetical protein
MNFTRIAVLGFALMLALPLAAQDKKGAPAKAADSNMQILMDKIKADKKLVVAANMQLNDADGKKFWPIYDSYQKDLDGINKRMAAVIKEYADAYNKQAVTDGVAQKLLPEMMSIEQAEVDLRKSYSDKVTKSLSAIQAARYMQIEGKIRALVRYELAGGIPLVPN